MIYLGNGTAAEYTSLPVFTNTQPMTFPQDFQAVMIAALALNAIAVVGGVIASCVNKGANIKVHAFNLAFSAISAAALFIQYQVFAGLSNATITTSIYN